jgi:hypothetical protein
MSKAILDFVILEVLQSSMRKKSKLYETLDLSKLHNMIKDNFKFTPKYCWPSDYEIRLAWINSRHTIRVLKLHGANL